jgi:hypothetical protein
MSSPLAASSAFIVMPTIGHSVEFVVHAWAGTPELGRSIGASVAVSVFTTGFSLFVMRKGMFLARSDQTYRQDVRRLVLLVVRRVVALVVGARDAMRSARSFPTET